MNTGETHSGADTAHPRPRQTAGDRPGGPSARGGPEPGRRDTRRRAACARGALGRYGEDLAARRLREAGMAVLERNWRCAEGEIDIVARDKQD